MVRTAALLLIAMLVAAACTGRGFRVDPGSGLRHGRTGIFDATHVIEIAVPDGVRELRAWLAVPSENDPAQEITRWSVEAPGETRFVRDSWGNRFLYLSATSPASGTMRVVTRFRVERREVNAVLDPAATRPHTAAERAALAVYLEGSRESVIDADARALAARAVGDETNPIRASRRIYDAILEHVDYHIKDPKPDAAKTMHATGTGSSRKCYATRCGNCTDFHALYAAVSRAAGIPARAVYGSFFKLPLEGTDQDQSYHCWIEFHAPEIGWIPLDVAVADVFDPTFQANEHSRPRANLTVAAGYDGPSATLVDYYFGNIEERRVSWHWCRDLVLSPPQAGPPLPWLIGAHVELDGKPCPVRRTLTFREVGGEPAPETPASGRG